MILSLRTIPTILNNLFERLIGGIILGIIVIVIIGLILWAIGIYNRFVTLKNSYEATLGQIRVAMQK